MLDRSETYLPVAGILNTECTVPACWESLVAAAPVVADRSTDLPRRVSNAQMTLVQKVYPLPGVPDKTWMFSGSAGECFHSYCLLGIEGWMYVCDKLDRWVVHTSLSRQNFKLRLSDTILRFSGTV